MKLYREGWRKSFPRDLTVKNKPDMIDEYAYVEEIIYPDANHFVTAEKAFY